MVYWESSLFKLITYFVSVDSVTQEKQFPF